MEHHVRDAHAVSLIILIPSHFVRTDRLAENILSHLNHAECIQIPLQLSDYASSSLSSCDLGLIANKDSKAETVGDVLCERAYDAYNFPSEPKFWFTALVEIGAYVTYCGTSWQEVSTGGKHLVLNEKLCCVRNRKSGQVKYRPCNGAKRTSEKCA